MSRVRGLIRVFCLTAVSTVFLWVSAATAEANTIRVPTDVPTVTAAVAAAADGDKIVIVSGSYDETVVVSGFADLTIKARAGASIVRPANGATPLSLVDCNRVRVSGLVVLGGATAGISVSGCADIKIDKCDVRAGDGHGVWIWDSHRVKVAKCVVSDRGIHGVFINHGGLPSPPSDCLVVACKIFRAGSFGVKADHGSGHQILRCKAFDSHAVGFELNSDNGRMERNTVKRTNVFACYGIRGTNNVCRLNRGEGAGKEGIYVGGTDAVVERNDLRNCAWGIWVPGSDNDIRKNFIDTTASWGIVSTGVGNFVELNTVLRAGGTALGIRSNDGEYRSNKLKFGKSFGIDMDNADGNQVVSNTIVMSLGSAFVVRATSTGNTIATNKAKKNLGNGLDDLSAPGSNTFLDNIFTGL